MGINIPKDFIYKNLAVLDEKKPQTTQKIKYISNYAEKWLYVVTNSDSFKNINFVDCMCNAGVYADGDLGTAVRVLELFNRVAPSHPEKNFTLFLNDYDTNRIDVISTVINQYVGVLSPNISVQYSCKDVNDYLSNISYFKTYFDCYPNGAANLIFVDPYNFCAVKFTVLERLLNEFYCELLYNVFTSDFTRNQEKKKIQLFCASENIKSTSRNEIINEIKNRFKGRHIKYSFSYEFKSQTNNEIYQIAFFTPNERGLEKLKEALWDTFDGKEFHRNETGVVPGQLSFFTSSEMRSESASHHSISARNMLVECFNGEVLSYKNIEMFIIENTLLGANHIISHILKPLIKSGNIVKQNNEVKANNYKQDRYKIRSQSL